MEARRAVRPATFGRIAWLGIAQPITSEAVKYLKALADTLAIQLGMLVGKS
jgi:hypothetical protein